MLQISFLEIHQKKNNLKATKQLEKGLRVGKLKSPSPKPDSGITLSRILVVRDAYTPTDQSTTPFSGRLPSLHISDVSSSSIRNFHNQPNISFALLTSYSISHENWHWL